MIKQLSIRKYLRGFIPSLLNMQNFAFLLLIINIVNCEYENTWNFYYEQQCCGNSNGHHLRHHKGN